MPLGISSTRVRVSVNSSALDRMFLPGGDVWAWGRRVGLEMMEVAIATAPSRTGYLKTQHGFNQTPVGKQHARVTIYNDSDYARFVHGGTTGPITSNRAGGMLTIRPAPYSWFHREVPVMSVRGQSANPWLSNAMQDVLARHGIR
jgi:hypothetical protein